MLQKRDALLISLLNRRHDDDDDDENYYYYYYNAASGYVVIGKSVKSASLSMVRREERAFLYRKCRPKKPFPYKNINPKLNREDKP